MTYCAEAGNSLFANVGLHLVDAFNNDVETEVKLFVVDQQGVLDIPLQQVLLAERVLRQVRELLNQGYAFAASTP